MKAQDKIQELSEVETDSLPDRVQSTVCKDDQRIFRRKMDAQREKLDVSNIFFKNKLSLLERRKCHD